MRLVKDVNISVDSTSIGANLSSVVRSELSGLSHSAFVFVVARVFTSVAKTMEFDSCVLSASVTSPEPHLSHMLSKLCVDV